MSCIFIFENSSAIMKILAMSYCTILMKLNCYLKRSKLHQDKRNVSILELKIAEK